MQPLPRQRVVAAVAAVALVIAYQVAVHQLIATKHHPLVTMYMGLLPFALVLVAVALGTGWRLGAVWVPIVIIALGWLWRAPLQANFGWIYLAEHVGTQTLLGLMFARTLRRGHTPLITQFALRVHAGVLSQEQFHYTRQATRAWGLFFALDALISLALFAWAPLSTWSFFANLLTLPLVVAMFIAEYLVRRMVLPKEPHVSIAAGARVFWDNRRTPDARGTSI